MTGSAKQSSFGARRRLDCFVASTFRLRSASFGGRGRSLSSGGRVAPRNDVKSRHGSADLAARCARAVHEAFAQKNRGRRECRMPHAPAASRATLVTCATPLCWDGTARISELIWACLKQKYFCKRGWTGHFGKHEVICPSGKIGWPNSSLRGA